MKERKNNNKKQVKQLKKFMLVFAAAMLVAGSLPVTAVPAQAAGKTSVTKSVASSAKSKGKWVKSGKRWWYRHSDGSYPHSEWEKINKKWYHFDASGWMQTGWKKIGGKWYYMNKSGAMQTGWEKVGGKWYYMNKSGVMQTGWEKVGGKWYYMDKSGVMQTGWEKVGGKWYYMDKSGVMQTGWQKVGGKWYYMDKSGAMAVNTWIGENYVDSNGVWNETKKQHTHTWRLESANVKNGYACNGCGKDVTSFSNLYSCHGGWHTHQWYLTPDIHVCTTCGEKRHSHIWGWMAPVYYNGSDKMVTPPYWVCVRCGNVSVDGRTVAGYTYRSDQPYGRADQFNTWLTGYDFSGSDIPQVVQQTIPAGNVLKLQGIDIDTRASSNFKSKMKIGEAFQAQVLYTPLSTNSDKGVTWESSNPAVASVSPSGYITANGVGQTTITVTSRYNSSLKDTHTITVTN